VVRQETARSIRRGRRCIRRAFSSGATNAYFVKTGSGTLTLTAAARSRTADYNYNQRGKRRHLSWSHRDITLQPSGSSNGAHLIVTNNATLDGFIGNYIFWQDCTRGSVLRKNQRPEFASHGTGPLSALLCQRRGGVYDERQRWITLGKTTAMSTSPLAAANSNGCRRENSPRMGDAG
jgi:hypothetical protein